MLKKNSRKFSIYYESNDRKRVLMSYLIISFSHKNIRYKNERKTFAF